MHQSKVWSKDFVVLFVTFFFVALTFWLLMPTMAVYAIERFRASESQAGLTVGIFVIGALAVRPLSGRFIEVVGRRRMLIASLLASLVAMLLYVPAADPALLLAVRFAHGAAFGAATTAMPTIIVDIIPRHRRGEGIAVFMLSPTLAAAIGPFVGLAIVQHAGYRAMFLLCALLYAMSVLATLCARIPEAAEGDAGAAKASAWHDLYERSALAVSIVMLLVGTAFSGIVTFLSSFAIEIGQTAAAGFFFLVHAVFILVSRPLTGRLLDARGDNIVMFPALAAFAAGLALLAVADRASVLLASAALVGLGFGTTMSCAQAIAVKRAPPQRVGLATSTFFFCLDAGMGGGPFLIGTIIPLVGFRWTYVTLAGVVVVSILLYDRMHGSAQRARGRDRGEAG